MPLAYTVEYIRTHAKTAVTGQRGVRVQRGGKRFSKSSLFFSFFLDSLAPFDMYRQRVIVFHTKAVSRELFFSGSNVGTPNTFDFRRNPEKSSTRQAAPKIMSR